MTYDYIPSWKKINKITILRQGRHTEVRFPTKEQYAEIEERMENVTRLNITYREIYETALKVHNLGVFMKVNDGTQAKWKAGVTPLENGKFIEQLYGIVYTPLNAIEPKPDEDQINSESDQSKQDKRKVSQKKRYTIVDDNFLVQ